MRQRPFLKSIRWCAFTAMSCLAACSGALTSLAQQTVVAYVVPAATVGNQAFGGVLGMDFDVNNPVVITRLGVFDDNSDGMKLTITARLWDRATQTEMAAIEFTPEDPGELVAGSRFKTLPTPIRLEIGFQGTISAEGYGAEEQLRNRLNNAANIVWTTQDGDGSLVFVGTSRYGVTAGAYPDTADGGPAARYAAGTFEFQTTPPLLPGKPTVTLKPGDGQVAVTWLPVTSPLAAAKYRVLRSADPAGVLSQIAEIEGTNYVDAPVPNGAPVCYVVRAVGANGKTGPDSDVKCTAPYSLAPNHQIAYLTPAASGNQAFGGSLGMEFDLDNPILVKRLGVFDDGADGLKLPITARIFNRQTQEIVAELTFAEGEGVLIEGMRLKALPQPLRLEAGFQGVMQADGYGAAERLLNSHGDSKAITWTLNDGNGAILFVGSSRYGLSAGAFPDVVDGGPAARYATGTFEFEILPPERPARPVIAAAAPYEDAAVVLTWSAVSRPMAVAKYRVFRGADAAGPFTQVAETTQTTYRDTGLQNGVAVYYMVRTVAEGGQVSFDSNVATSTPNPRAPGVAYVVVGGIAAAGTYGGSLGMDFDVARPVRITELGAYDDLADGLSLPLTVALFNRDTQERIASVDFTPESPGSLRDSSRFKALSQPVSLPAGFKGVIAAWGYGAEERYFSNGQNLAELTVFSGGSLLFVGSGRYGTAGEFPGTVDSGPVNRYAAGTFYFEPATEPPQVAIGLAGQKVKLTWSGSGRLENAPNITGPWTEVSGAASGVELPIEGNRKFYRVRQ